MYRRTYSYALGSTERESKCSPVSGTNRSANSWTYANAFHGADAKPDGGAECRSECIAHSGTDDTGSTSRRLPLVHLWTGR